MVRGKKISLIEGMTVAIVNLFLGLFGIFTTIILGFMSPPKTK